MAIPDKIRDQCAFRAFPVILSRRAFQEEEAYVLYPVDIAVAVIKPGLVFSLDRVATTHSDGEMMAFEATPGGEAVTLQPQLVFFLHNAGGVPRCFA